ncbi:hypothetical protein BB559_002867 [Furculomyces boomerangus]|uniref:CN hydrolase domain-containing protein n=2 Tax=Harpellales TaxID=61421 RepID=A0A2T9YRM1_9FUNG|nr:hypothetical protein BB559_002867 [Furculomyces boomerangus]PVZ98479.1 hypothetical protein BB558_005520 [Smittium angustum]
MNSFKLALVQLKVGAKKAQNLINARKMVMTASSQGAKLVILPECFNSPYGTQYFEENAEKIDSKDLGESTSALSQMAKEAQIYLVGGSIPEIEPESGKIFNTCTVWNDNGEMIAKHRKVHLFDIDVPNKIRFIESEVLSPGEKLTSFQSPWGKIGLGICYDVRFPEMAMVAARQGCFAMLYPGAFNMTTGPLHWEALLRASPAQDTSATYHAWGHSSVINPKGEVTATCGFEETIVYAEIDKNAIEEIRTSIPIYTQRRFDLYPDVSKSN